MNFDQLELELNLVLQDAAEVPAMANFNALWQQLEPVLVQLPLQEQLRLGSQVIERLAGIHQAKADALFDDWENAYDPQDPLVSGDWLQGLVRQTQHLNLSELTTPRRGRPRAKTAKPESVPETVVGEVPKANLLQMLDQVEAEDQQVAALALAEPLGTRIAHEERVQEWVSEIDQWFEQHPEPIELLQFQRQLQWPLVQLWLSLLLGEFRLEAIETDFYSPRIQVSRP
jgi:hypothetical protein